MHTAAARTQNTPKPYQEALDINEASKVGHIGRLARELNNILGKPNAQG
jgi:hypothetical protein